MESKRERNKQKKEGREGEGRGREREGREKGTNRRRREGRERFEESLLLVFDNDPFFTLRTRGRGIRRFDGREFLRRVGRIGKLELKDGIGKGISSMKHKLDKLFIKRVKGG